MKLISTKRFREFLKIIGCVYIRTLGDHEIWDKKDGSLLRPVIFRSNEKEIPILHLHTNLKTLGITHKEFEKIISEL